MTVASRPSSLRIYTIGHSTREWTDFLRLLAREGIRRLVDVRAFPGSKRHPQYNKEQMRTALPGEGIEYVHAPELGGRRQLRPDAPKTAWRNASFAAYADYMRSVEFRSAIARLRAQAAEYPTTIMCSEAVPWRCHRTLVSDALLASGVEVLHILDARTSAHTLTSFAHVRDGEARYDAEEQSELSLSSD